MYNDSIISIIHLDNISIGIHCCGDVKLSLNDYLIQSSCDAYNCMVRYKMINDKNRSLLVMCISDKLTPILVCPIDNIINKENIKIPKINTDVMDAIKVIYSDKIHHYEPYIKIPLEKEILFGFKKCIEEFKIDDIITIGSKIWNM